MPAAERSESGYRLYRPADVHTLGFIRHARDLGFSIPMIGELVGLWKNKRRSSRVVKDVAQAHIEQLDQKAQAILAMKGTLEHLVHCCKGDDRPECPIIETLAADAEEQSLTLAANGENRSARRQRF